MWFFAYYVIYYCFFFACIRSAKKITLIVAITQKSERAQDYEIKVVMCRNKQQPARKILAKLIYLCHTWLSYCADNHQLRNWMYVRLIKIIIHRFCGTQFILTLYDRNWIFNEFWRGELWCEEFILGDLVEWNTLGTYEVNLFGYPWHLMVFSIQWVSFRRNIARIYSRTEKPTKRATINPIIYNSLKPFLRNAP